MKINDDAREVEILFDSGAGVSVMSEELFPYQKHIKNYKVHGIGGTGLAGDSVLCEILISSTWKTQHHIKPMSIPGREKLLILGRDFLKQFGSTEFDWTNQKIRIGNDWIFMVTDNVENDIFAVVDKCKIGKDLSVNQQLQVKKLLHEFCEAFVKNSKAPKLCTTEVHRILSKDESVVKDKVRRIPNLWKGEISRQIQEMQENGIIRPSKSPYNSNPVLVNKNDGSKRFVIDFRNLNKNSVQDSYPLPDVNDLIDVCLDCNFFTQLDLASGYWCLEINENDRKKTAFSVPNGKFEFNRMPFGLKNGQATMQRTMDKVKNEILELSGKSSGIDVYVDNVFIFSKTFEEHLRTLKIVFEVAMKHNLSLKAEKCEIGFNEIDFLGFHVAKNSVSPSLENVKKLLDFPEPTSKKKLQSFLGLANFNRKFIRKYAEVTKPLTSILSDKVKFEWTEAQRKSFGMVKDLLANVPSLGLPDFQKPFYIQTDGSDIAVGGILFQYDDENEKIVLGYHSKTIKKSQLNWTVTEKEMYSVKVCCAKWNVYCNGKVIIRTDHEPLKFIHKHKDSRGKIIRWLLEMESIDYTIEYVKGPENEAADALSRVIIEGVDDYEDDDHIYKIEDSEQQYCNWNKIKAEQQNDQVLKYVIKRLSEGKEIRKGPFRNVKGLSVTDGILLKRSKVVIPEKLQKLVIDELHGQYHQGIENTTILIRSRFWWKRMVAQIEEAVKDCQSCASCKPQKSPKAEMVINDKIPESRESISMDIGSMPLTPRGMCCFLLMVDLATKFASVAVLSNQQAYTLKNALWDKWFSIFGLPNQLRSDQGRNVDGNIINELCEQLAILKKRSSPYHPEGNGLAERSIGSIKSLVSVICESRKLPVTDWDTVIHEAVLAHNNTVNKSLKYSPFMCMFGNNGQLPVDNFMGIKSNELSEKLDRNVVMEDAKANMKEAAIQHKKQYDKNCHQNNFTVGQEVMLKRNFGANPKISANWVKGPYYIDKTIGPVNYSVKGPKGGCKVIHHNNLRPVMSSHEATKTVHNNIRTCSNEIMESVPVVSDVITSPNNPIHRVLDNTMDRNQFRDNVLSNNVEPVTRTLSGRVVKQTKFYGVNN